VIFGHATWVEVVYPGVEGEDGSRSISAPMTTNGSSNSVELVETDFVSGGPP
jgi:hypothetical protein